MLCKVIFVRCYFCVILDIISPSIPFEDEESYDDVDNSNSSPMIRPPPLRRANSPIDDDDDIYEVVPGKRLRI